MATNDMSSDFKGRIAEVNQQLDTVYAAMVVAQETPIEDEEKYREAQARYDILLKEYKNLLQCLSMLVKSYYDMKNILNDSGSSGKPTKSVLQELRGNHEKANKTNAR